MCPCVTDSLHVCVSQALTTPAPSPPPQARVTGPPPPSWPGLLTLKQKDEGKHPDMLFVCLRRPATSRPISLLQFSPPPFSPPPFFPPPPSASSPLPAPATSPATSPPHCLSRPCFPVQNNPLSHACGGKDTTATCLCSLQSRLQSATVQCDICSFCLPRSDISKAM